MRSSGFAERQIKRNDSCFLPYLATAGSTESVWKSFLKIKKLCGLMTIFLYSSSQEHVIMHKFTGIQNYTLYENVTRRCFLEVSCSFRREPVYYI